MHLGKLIDALEKAPPSLVVKNGFGKPMSYRGYYDQVAFEPVGETTIGAMLAYAKSAIGPTFTGYKGGDYTYDYSTEAWVASYSCCAEDPISEADVARWLQPELAPVRVGDTASADDPFTAVARDLVAARRRKSEAKAAIELAQKDLADAEAGEASATESMGKLLPPNGGVRAVAVGADIVFAEVLGQKACGTVAWRVAVANSQGEVQ